MTKLKLFFLIFQKKRKKFFWNFGNKFYTFAKIIFMDYKTKLQRIGRELTGKEINALVAHTNISKSTIYNYLNGAIIKIEIAERIIESGELIINNRDVDKK